VNGDWRDAATGLAVALGSGLLIGLERERRKQERGESAERDAAGIRSFAIAALGGALAQTTGQPLLVALAAAAVVALSAIAYRASRQAMLGQAEGDPGLTTELALVVTYLIGVLAIPQPALAAAVAVVVALLLAARERLHRFATQWLSEAELHDGLLLAALALVLLPLVPATPQPMLGGLAPRALLWLLLLILLLQAAGHVALRVAGLRAGLALSGFFSGFVSSTATIASLGTRARRAEGERQACAAGGVFSAAATWVQAMLMLGALAPEAARALAPAALAGGLVTVTVGWLYWRRAAHTTTAAPAAAQGGPLRVREAALVAGVLAAVAVAVAWARGEFGDAGLFTGTVLAAAADAHAPVATLAALNAAGQVGPAIVRDGALLAIGTNSLTRIVVAYVSGGRAYGHRLAAALGTAVLAALGAALLS
jgi:uncharacterized membrane protein (DUF4010 family)